MGEKDREVFIIIYNKNINLICKTNVSMQFNSREGIARTSHTKCTQV